MIDLDLNSGWSYCNDQIIQFKNDLLKKNNISILELGAGDSSVKLYNYFKSMYEIVSLTCYETDENWAPSNDNIKLIMYDIPENVKFNDTIYDLILVDGPTGVSRKLWYNKLTNSVHPGTIIHIDDYDHYEEFEQELKLNFSYEELYRKSRSKKGEKSWLTVKIK